MSSLKELEAQKFLGLSEMMTAAGRLPDVDERQAALVAMTRIVEIRYAQCTDNIHHLSRSMQDKGGDLLRQELARKEALTTLGKEVRRKLAFLPQQEPLGDAFRNARTSSNCRIGGATPSSALNLPNALV